jgi:quinol monooxygenase YgiN
MSVTVVARWQVAGGDEEHIIATARQALDVRGRQPPARREAHVFQALDDPCLLLYVGEWDDRAAFELHQAANGTGSVEAAIRSGGEYIICERQVFFGRFAARALVVGCAIMEAPPEASETVRALLLPDGRWTARGAPGLVHYTVFREMNHRQRFVVVHGWQSEAALRDFRDRPSTLRAGVMELGGSFSQFTGIERASTDRL